MSISEEEEEMVFDFSDLGVRGDEGNEGDVESSREDDYPHKSSAKPLMSLRQRRRSKVGVQPLKINLNKIHWMDAISKAKKVKDPWEKFHLDELPTEIVVRHRYNAIRRKWTTDTVKVKIDTESFNRGAMRQCYRLKKLSTFTHSENWKHALNYVAKRYIENVERNVYFEDVKLQMDAKLWGEEYNRHNPPKKVDIFQMYILEFTSREGSPLYHLEHYIEGEYIKYNSNSGFVEETSRLTPQAFSHFTFERSGHELIVVDIQGVGDLYTDPQIHTSRGLDYGDGNLGTKGMALFFHSHVCNNICEGLGLSQFDLSDKELAFQKKYVEIMKTATTRVRNQELELVSSPSPRERGDLTGMLSRSRNTSECSLVSPSNTPSDADMLSHRPSFARSDSEPMSTGDSVNGFSRTVSFDSGDPPAVTSPSDSDIPSSANSASRSRYTSESGSVGSTTEDEGRAHLMMKHTPRPSCFTNELNLRNLQQLQKMGDSILGQVHHELAKYHEIGRFVIDPTEGETAIDWDSALYHEEKAAQLAVMEACITIAKIYLQIPHDILVNCTVEDTEDNLDRGVDYMLMAAHAGCRASMIFMAKAYETGENLGTERTRSYEEALKWYQKASEMEEEDDSGSFDAIMEDPTYQLLAKQAELYRSGGTGMQKNLQKSGDLYTEAADAAMAAMKGRLANKYYALAEEAWGEMDSEE